MTRAIYSAESATRSSPTVVARAKRAVARVRTTVAATITGFGRSSCDVDSGGRFVRAPDRDLDPSLRSFVAARSALDGLECAFDAARTTVSGPDSAFDEIDRAFTAPDTGLDHSRFARD